MEGRRNEGAGIAGAGMAGPRSSRTRTGIELEVVRAGGGTMPVLVVGVSGCT